MLHGPESLEGAEILEEIRGPLGLLLWRCARDVNLWCLAVDAEARVGLFSPEAAERHRAAVLAADAPGEAQEPLLALAGMLAHPADASHELVMLACSRLSQWAEQTGATGTALAWAQAAALACPTSAYAALRVGQLARRRGEYARAEGWLQRTVTLARQGADRDSHAAAYSALGNLRFVRGNMPAAERCHRRALRIARRFGLRQRAAAALHDLFVVCAELGRGEEALEHVREALPLYRSRHPALPALAHDVAVFWMLRGQHARALPVLLVVWPHMSPHQQITGIANVARSAAATGDRATFEAYWERAWEVVRSADYAEKHPSVLLELARGAIDLGDIERARLAAATAASLAGQLGEHKAAFASEALLQSLEEGESAAPAPVSTPSLVEDHPEDELARELVGCFAGAA